MKSGNKEGGESAFPNYQILKILKFNLLVINVLIFC